MTGAVNNATSDLSRAVRSGPASGCVSPAATILRHGHTNRRGTTNERAGSGAARSLSSKPPAGMIASRPLRVRCGIGLPHRLQNAVAKLRASGRSKRTTNSCPRSHRSAAACTITSQEWAAPVALRQREQWQFRKRSNGPSTSNATSPHRQLPRNADMLCPHRCVPPGVRCDVHSRPRLAGAFCW